MKRLYTAIAFLLLAIIISISGYIILNERINLLNDALGEAALVAKQEDSENIDAQTKEVLHLWEDNVLVLSSILMHADIDKIDIGINKLKFYSEEKDFKRYAETCDESIAYLNQITDSEKLNYGNIL